MYRDLVFVPVLRFVACVLLSGFLFNDVYGGWMSEAFRRMRGGELRVFLNGRLLEGDEVFYTGNPLVLRGDGEGQAEWFFSFTDGMGEAPQEWVPARGGRMFFEFPGSVTDSPGALLPGVYHVKLKVVGGAERVMRVVKLSLVDVEMDDAALSGEGNFTDLRCVFEPEAAGADVQVLYEFSEPVWVRDSGRMREAQRYVGGREMEVSWKGPGRKRVAVEFFGEVIERAVDVLQPFVKMTGVVLAVNANDSDENGERDMEQLKVDVEDPDLARLIIYSPFNNGLRLDSPEGGDDLGRLREERVVMRLSRTRGVNVYMSRMKGVDNRLLYAGLEWFNSRAEGNGYVDYRFGERSEEEDRAFLSGIYMEGVLASGEAWRDGVDVLFMDNEGDTMTLFKTPITAVHMRMNYTPDLKDLCGDVITFFTPDTPLNRIVNPAVIPVEEWDGMDEEQKRNRCAVLEVNCREPQVTDRFPEFIEWRVMPPDAGEEEVGGAEIVADTGKRVEVLGRTKGFVTIGIGVRGFEEPYIRYRAYVDGIRKVPCIYNVFSWKDGLSDLPGLEQNIGKLVDRISIANIFLRQIGLEAYLRRDVEGMQYAQDIQPQVRLDVAFPFAWLWSVEGNPYDLVLTPDAVEDLPYHCYAIVNEAGEVLKRDISIRSFLPLPGIPQETVFFYERMPGSYRGNFLKLDLPDVVEPDLRWIEHGVVLYRNQPEWVAEDAADATVVVARLPKAINLNIGAIFERKAVAVNIVTPPHKFSGSDFAGSFEHRDEGGIMRRSEVSPYEPVVYGRPPDYGVILFPYYWLEKQEHKLTGDYTRAGTVAHEILHVLGLWHRVWSNIDLRYNRYESIPDGIATIGFLPQVDVEPGDIKNRVQLNNEKNLLSPGVGINHVDVDLIQALIVRGSSLLE